MSDQVAFDGYLRSLDFERLQDVISSLESYEEQYGAEQAVPASTVLLNLLPDLPVRDRGFFSLDTRTVVMRVVYRLIRALHDPATIEKAVREILPKLTSLGSRNELILCVGHREGVGNKLIAEEPARAIETAWRAEVRAASHDRLLMERELFWILNQTRRESAPEESVFLVPDSPQFTLAVLRSARSDVRSQAIGNRSIKRSARLPWDSLLQLFGDEASLRKRVECLRMASLNGASESLQLVDRYLDGNAPRDFDDE
jgi:hypothetical protein